VYCCGDRTYSFARLDIAVVITFNRDTCGEKVLHVITNNVLQPVRPTRQDLNEKIQFFNEVFLNSLLELKYQPPSASFDLTSLVSPPPPHKPKPEIFDEVGVW
jgi:hypothetical protein